MTCLFTVESVVIRQRFECVQQGTPSLAIVFRRVALFAFVPLVGHVLDSAFDHHLLLSWKCLFFANSSFEQLTRSIFKLICLELHVCCGADDYFCFCKSCWLSSIFPPAFFFVNISDMFRFFQFLCILHPHILFTLIPRRLPSIFFIFTKHSGNLLLLYN